jgi:hypothetical protein
MVEAKSEELCKSHADRVYQAMKELGHVMA